MSRIAVVGLGLIGGSIALGSRARGYDSDAGVRERARRRGLEVAEDLATAVGDAGLVVLAVPTAAIQALLAETAALAPAAVLTDAASLKRPVVEAASRLPERARVVGGHPMAGGRAPGIEGADAGLFHDRPWAIVRTARSDDAAVAAVADLARSLGGSPIELDAARHDHAMTWVSHLPLVVASALARAAAEGAGDDFRTLAGPGLRDSTRLASTPGALALELALADPAALAKSLGETARSLVEIAAALRAGDTEALQTLLAEARRLRRPLDV